MSHTPVSLSRHDVWFHMMEPSSNHDSPNPAFPRHGSSILTPGDLLPGSDATRYVEILPDGLTHLPAPNRRLRKGPVSASACSERSELEVARSEARFSADHALSARMRVRAIRCGS